MQQSSTFPTAVADGLPDIFCWTKMGLDSSQSLPLILQRKDHERLYGNGLVWWGVGEHVPPRINALARQTQPNDPLIVFSPDKKAQKALEKAKKSIEMNRPILHRALSTENARVLVWEEYLEDTGLAVRIPSHALVLSSANTTEYNNQKTRYFALICRFDAPLTEEVGQSFCPDQFQNLITKKDKFGQQVTIALQRKQNKVSASSVSYPIRMFAHLASPYVVTLVKPRLLSEEERLRTDTAGTRTLSCDEWMDLVNSIRGDV